MAPSPLFTAFHRSFDEHFLPLLKQLGLQPAKAKNVKPTQIVAKAARSLSEERRVEATLWCDASTGANLRFRFDVVEPINGVECTRQLDLKVPWPDPAYPRPLSLDFSAKDFLVNPNEVRLAVAIEFLAGAFAASVISVQSEVPELGQELRQAASTASGRRRSLVPRGCGSSGSSATESEERAS